MYLSELHIENFRCIEKLTLEFNKGLNVIIGENNTGKTAVIDALRLAFSIGSERRSIFVDDDDFFKNQYGISSNTIEFHLVFNELSDEEQGTFIDMLSVDKESEEAYLKLHLRYELQNKDGINKIRFEYWGGDNEGQNISPNVMDLFYHVYLGALRDVERELSPKKGNRLSELISKLVDEPQQEKLALSINEKVKADKDWRELIGNAKKKINEHLKKTSLGGDTQSVIIDFLSLKFKKIAEDLKIFRPFCSTVNKEKIVSKFGDNKLWKVFFENPDADSLLFKPEAEYLIVNCEEIEKEMKDSLLEIYHENLEKFELSANGLGYNNLIYIATVLGDLFERREKKTESYISLLIEEPEAHLHPQLQDILFNYFKEMEFKDIQVFISSHSPTITAKTEIDSLYVLQNIDSSIEVTSLRKLPLSEPNKKYLERFLDVTKSQLFFAKGVILVEGISEALLLPVFADIMREDYNLDRNGIEVVNIGGVAFEPFAKLFNSKDKKNRLNAFCSILTDDDRKNDSEISSRAQNALDLEGGNLIVKLANITFEYELYCLPENERLILETCKEMHLRFRVEQHINIEERANNFCRKIKNNKAIFAQNLASKIKDSNYDFRVPRYIQDAIKWVILKGEK